jgi:hypothetical protein
MKPTWDFRIRLSVGETGIPQSAGQGMHDLLQAVHFLGKHTPLRRGSQHHFAGGPVDRESQILFERSHVAAGVRQLFVTKEQTRDLMGAIAKSFGTATVGIHHHLLHGAPGRYWPGQCLANLLVGVIKRQASEQAA